MSSKLLISFFVVSDVGNLAVPLIPIFFATTVDFTLLLRGEFLVEFLSNLEFEGERDGWLLRALVFLRRIVIVVVVVVVVESGGLLLLPASEYLGTKGGLPGVGTIRLYGRKLPLPIDTGGEGAWISVITC